MKIDWDIIGTIEVIKNDWQLVELEGFDDKGNRYLATCETYISYPCIIEDNIDDIELVLEDLK